MKYLRIDYTDGTYSLGDEVPPDHPEAVPMSEDLYRFWLLHCEESQAWQRHLLQLDNERYERIEAAEGKEP